MKYFKLLVAMIRKSKQRDAILRVLRSTNTHPTVQWIYDQVRHEIPNISMGTVYRNLKLLKKEDKERTQRLELLGYKVIRFQNEEVEKNIHKVLEKLKMIFDQYEKQ